MPAGLGLGEGPAGQLLDLVAAAGAGACVARAGRPAFVVGDGVLEVGVAGGSGAGWPGAGVVADLDQAAQPVAGQVGVDPVAVVAVVGGHDVEPDGELPPAGQGEYPGSGVAWGDVPGAGRWR